MSFPLKPDVAIVTGYRDFTPALCITRHCTQLCLSAVPIYQ
ncbi:hypothetical protein D083_2384 [Dickeya solani RNS 08.23.3.1.A]|nr:hypothetical protein D083_2384 [Dickeya solani RNS 08.23.3.1.A]